MILLGTEREGGDELRECKEGLMRQTAESTIAKRNGTNIVDCGEINKEFRRLTLFGSCQASNALEKNNRHRSRTSGSTSHTLAIWDWSGLSADTAMIKETS
jgi:hypothetical protein